MDPGLKGRYANRLDLEGQAIEKLNMAGYLLALSEVVGTVRSGRHPIGRGRGSSINSFGLPAPGHYPDRSGCRRSLLFERFLNVNRAELPDVDVDVSRKAASMIHSEIKRLFPEAYGLRTFGAAASVRSFLPKIMAVRGFKAGAIEAFRAQLKESGAPEARTWEEVVKNYAAGPRNVERPLRVNAKRGQRPGVDGSDRLSAACPLDDSRIRGVAVCAQPSEDRRSSALPQE